MIEWNNAEFPPEVGRYLIFRNGQIRTAQFDGIGWIESVEWELFKHTTHWAKLPKSPVEIEQEREEYRNSEYCKLFTRYVEHFFERYRVPLPESCEIKDDICQ